jgi:hypothetical protein
MLPPGGALDDMAGGIVGENDCPPLALPEFVGRKFEKSRQAVK